ncbi:jg3618 [Pararge aegeria aegeria]|uniref:Jg3618 protein n=1 Tax=Pararge aegeria aegeria TaxID=348720 RepID=A0A8S4RAU3_9NEOP|nr:jg3618 [Pararge aegeria aegeria]
MLKFICGGFDVPSMLGQLLRIFAPDMSIRLWRCILFVEPAARTVARARSPIPRILFAINAVLEAKPDLDVFADEWMKITRQCLEFCEKLF